MAWRKGKGFYQRFWEKIDICGPDECWPWMGCRNSKGNGLIRLASEDGSKMKVASRVMMVMKTGRLIPPGLVVMHSCDNPPCVNPAHLSIGTLTDNMQDMIAKGRQRFGGHTYPYQPTLDADHRHDRAPEADYPQQIGAKGRI